jgi:hypothetical protein
LAEVAVTAAVVEVVATAAVAGGVVAMAAVAGEVVAVSGEVAATATVKKAAAVEAVPGEGAAAGFFRGRTRTGTGAAPRLNLVAAASGGFPVLPQPSRPRSSCGGSDSMIVRTFARVNLVMSDLADMLGDVC